MNLKKLIKEEKEKFQNLDLNTNSFDDFVVLPITLKAISGLAIIVFIYFLFNTLILSTKTEQSEKASQKVEKALSEIDLKIASSSNYSKHQEQLSELKDIFKELQSQLPREINMQGLLNDITNSAIGNGLEIKDITFEEEIINELYIEQPIKIDLEGTYHNLGMFASALANTNRIITLHDFNIKPNDKEDSKLNITIIAKTYKYKNVSEGEI